MPGDSSKLGKMRRALRKMKMTGQKDIMTSKLGQMTNLTTVSVGLRMWRLADEFEIEKVEGGHWRFV
jgi:hypothetical protein